MKCAICGISIDLTDGAINQDWIPFFYEGDEEHGPVCFSCSEQLIRMGKDGEFELKDEYRGKITYLEENYEEHDMIALDLGVILN